MAYNHEYPYVDPNRYNSDWILNKIKEIEKVLTEWEAINKITFDGEWDITKNYPAWCIVNTNGGTEGYISIKPVPAGVVIANIDYWVSVVNYTATIADLQNRVIALEGDMTTAQSDITAIQNKLNAGNNICVVLGDSWTDLTESVYPVHSQWLADRVQNNSNIRVYGANGANSSHMDAQLDNAIADSAFDNSRVDTVIIVEGVNDYSDSTAVATYTSRMNALYNKIRANMPNAKVYQLFTCYSPFGTRNTGKNGKGCFNYFQNLTDWNGSGGLLYPCYSLSVYLPIQKCFNNEGEEWSVHVSAFGGNIVGQIFDQLLQHNVPTINYFVVSSDGYGTGYKFEAGGLTQADPSAVITYVYASGNTGKVKLRLLFSSPIANCQNFAINEDSGSSTYGGTAINPECWLFDTGYAAQENGILASACYVRDKLFTGTGVHAALQNSLFVSLDNQVSSVGHIILNFEKLSL